eukprot:11891685-Ditylum_brightwellii.AAC.1
MAPTRCLVLAAEVSLFILLLADGDRSPMPAALTGSVKSWSNSKGTSSTSKRAGTSRPIHVAMIGICRYALPGDFSSPKGEMFSPSPPIQEPSP